MKPIDEAKDFIFDFINWQHKVIKERWDSSISDEQQHKDYKYFVAKFFHHPAVIEFNNSTYMRTGLDSFSQDRLDHMASTRKKPEVFLIREYHNPQLGEGLKIDGNVIFNSIVGRDTSEQNLLLYATNYTFAEINGAMKMVCMRKKKVSMYPDGIIKWEVSPRSVYDAEDIRIIDDGSLVKTLRFEAPEFEESLADFKIG